jgi:hypothetical protein
MRRAVVLRRIAEREYDGAVGRYESEREGLGTEFRAVIEQHFQRIAENPDLFPKLRGEARARGSAPPVSIRDTLSG